jgi:hypothetical protein
MLSFGARVSYAFRCFFSLLLSGALPDDVRAYFTPAPRHTGGHSATPSPDAAAPPARPAPQEVGDRAVQLLAVLQREGRLVDFLREDLSGYSDAQVGTAVRSVHAGCREALDRYLSLEPILPDEEGAPTHVGPGVSPAAVKLVGDVRPGASARGIVRHRGWRVERIALPPLPATEARLIVAPAEVEVA